MMNGKFGQTGLSRHKAHVLNLDFRKERPRHSLPARDVMTAGIHCCREDEDLAKAVRHMEALKVRRLPVINKSKRMVGILSLGDISHSAPGELLSEWAKSISAHHH